MLLRRTRRFVVLTVATATLGSVVITSAPGGAAHATPGASGTTPSSIDWGDCPEDGSDQASADDPTSGRLECGTLRVPLDYERPDGRTIEIAVSRLRSTDPSARRGVLLLNPGGPGQARLTMPRDMVDRGLPSSVRQSYDLIGFDPRGVGKSSPVSGRTPGQVRRTYQDIAERLDAEPVAEMDGTGFRQTTRAMLYSDAAFGQLAQIWQGLSRREPTAARSATSVGVPTLTENFYSATLAIRCGDVSWPSSVETYQRNVAIDPATIYPEGLELRRVLDDRASLVTLDQGGHGAYLAGNRCADERVTRYLAHGTMPEGDACCSRDRDNGPSGERLDHRRFVLPRN